MDISVKQIDERTVIIKLAGKFNIEEVLNFENACREYIEKKVPTMGLDLSELKYIDSSGIGSLIKTMNITKNNNVELVLLDLQPDIHNVFKIAYLDKFFTISGKAEFLEKKRP